MSTSISGVSASPFSGIQPGILSQASKKSAFDGVLAEFMREVQKSPIERIKESILKAHRLTEDQYNAMPSGPEKDALTKEIEDAIKKAVTGNQEGTVSDTGLQI